jgi:hypothetical protein
MLFKGRYGEPILTRVYNNLPVLRSANDSGFGVNETQIHHQNAHNGAESDGAANVHHFPGTFYDYRWSTTLARRDKINTAAADPRASGPDGHGGLVNVAGDFRELQGTLWMHDHRFFFTAENVYKGNFSMVNYYSGPDRGNESLNDGVNLRLPSGSFLDYGNIDFDINLIVSDAATKPNGQLFFDIFNTDGFLGDLPLVNMAYAPSLNVLPRKYRFRILNAAMSRFWKLALAGPNGAAVPFKFIANDGNFVVNPITLTSLTQQGTAERYDICRGRRCGRRDSHLEFRRRQGARAAVGRELHPQFDRDDATRQAGEILRRSGQGQDRHHQFHLYELHRHLSAHHGADCDAGRETGGHGRPRCVPDLDDGRSENRHAGTAQGICGTVQRGPRMVLRHRQAGGHPRHQLQVRRSQRGNKRAPQ